MGRKPTSWQTLQHILRQAGKKSCVGCNRIRPLEEFKRRKSRKSDERSRFCPVCTRARIVHLKEKYNSRSFNPWTAGRGVLRVVAEAVQKVYRTGRPVTVVIHPPDTVVPNDQPFS